MNVSRETRYRKERDKYLSEHEFCEARIECRGLVATDIHHKSGRVGENMFKDFLAVCRRCHIWIEAYPADAKRLGFSNNRLK